MYSYDEFEKQARESGLYDQFSYADLQLARSNPDAGMSILSAKKDYSGATTDDQRALANAEANSIRNKYGSYTGGTTGSDYRLNSDSPYKYQPSEYTSQYKDKISDTLNKVQSSTYSYDPETDPIAQSYKKMYTREGDRATKNALGTAASATGGIPSSYAATAAAQAGQYYASQLSDQQAQLEERAYNRYMQEKTLDMQILEALENLEGTDYSRYADSRNFDYGQLLDQLEYQQGLESSRESSLLDRAKAMAEIGNFELYKMLGFTDEEVAELEAAWDAQNAPKTYYGSGYSSGSGTGTGADSSSGGVSVEDALSNVNSWLGQGASLSDINTQLREQYKAGIVPESEYKTYSFVTRQKGLDKSREERSRV